ncbi:exodeoxyribonuclease V subunit alpha [Marinomonas sp. C2222]|uniref:RecBCD enzyme subunit RecD n=1 Tax=Marinomonas sargassi TaxID=2984494 RepID=A0ABT2YN19_9GAMM|nr:exodeoxyribonuclease V subunit alpha [Marinomonas sargassi]MCV2401284.1 exodeoxyribonuclease V subunit alpha [Marinomonas sargassi]
MDSFKLINEAANSSNDLLLGWQQEGLLRAVDLHWIEQLACHIGETRLAVLISGALCSAQLGEGHICIDLSHIWETPLLDDVSQQGSREKSLDTWQLTLKNAGIRSPQQWCEILSESRLVCSPQTLSESAIAPCPMVLSGTRLYLFRYYQYEQQVLNYLTQQLSASPYVVSESLLTQLFPASPSTKTEHIDWQKVAVANAASLPFSVISGGPGTGKTTTVTKLLALLVAQAKEQGEALRIGLAAPTGKAAARLTESISQAKSKLPFDDEIKHSIPEKASTLHRLLGSDFGRSRFKHNKENPLHLDLLLIDEVSMVDLPMMAKVIEALPTHARLILLGDKDQLSSVEAGSVLGDLSYDIENAYFLPQWAEYLSTLTQEAILPFANANAPAISRSLTLLRTSYRFSSESGIGYLAKAMNAGDDRAVIQSLDAGYPDLEWCQPKVGQKKADIARLAQGYDEYWQAVRDNVDIEALYEVFSNYQILTAVRQGEFGVEKINAQLEHYFYQRGRIQDLHVWYPGKAVILTRNDAALGLFNGDIGLCKADDSGRLRVWFMLPDGSFTGLLPSRLGQFESVFAMTVHKSQGSEFERVALLLPMQPSPVLTKELLYTGITRAKQHFTLWGSVSLVRTATQSRIERYSGLIDALWNDRPT